MSFRQPSLAIAAAIAVSSTACPRDAGSFLDDDHDFLGAIGVVGELHASSRVVTTGTNNPGRVAQLQDLEDEFVFDVAKGVATELQVMAEERGFAPDRVIPSAAGGQFLYFKSPGKYGHIETFDDGQIVFAWRREGEPDLSVIEAPCWNFTDEFDRFHEFFRD